MTHQELHDHFDLLLDKSLSDWFNTSEKDDILTAAQREAVNQWNDEFEEDERVRQKLYPLIVEYNQATPGSVLLYSSLSSSLLFVLALRGNFDHVCGSVITTKDRNIRPMEIDDQDIAAEDPFNKGDNEFPHYVYTATGLEVISDTAPNSLRLKYIKVPTDIDAANNPTSSPELPENTHREIVERAVRKAMITIDDPSYQIQINEVNQTTQ